MVKFHFAKNIKNKIYVSIILVTLIISITFAACSGPIRIIGEGLVEEDNNLAQTDVHNAEHLFDEMGVPLLRIEGVGEVRHPGWIALYALQYSGSESFYGTTVNESMTKFSACIKWLEENLTKNQNGDFVWLYKFDNTYNDVNIKAPWFSAFGQAVGIEALVTAYNIDNDIKHLAAAERAARVLFRNIKDGGLLFQQGDDIWFEEIPTPLNNPTHILNGHMRTVLALKKLAIASNNKTIDEWASKGADTLREWLPQYDNGYWLRYDLNPKKDELLFRFTNPYGYELSNIPIDKITLRDPISGNEAILDVGFKDTEGELRIAGIDWGLSEEMDGRSVRRIKQVTPVSVVKDIDGEMHSPYTYFYLKLPIEWANNLREDWLELSIEYKDDIQGNISVQMRSICEGIAFRDLRDGDLLLTGSGKWRQWKIPIRPSDLGYWTGNDYAEKHALYLKELAEYYDELKGWEQIAYEYFNLSSENFANVKYVEVTPQELPEQTTMLPIFSFDNEGVVRFHIAGQNTVFKNGIWDVNTEGGPPVYSPYIISEQARLGAGFKHKYLMNDISSNMIKNYRDKYEWITINNSNNVSTDAAFKWLNNNKKIIKDSYVWMFPFRNVYNDVVQNEDWQSAFSQKYIIENYKQIDDKETVKKASYAYRYPTAIGGLSSFNKSGRLWFEEVPNNTHILNAHIASMVTLNNVINYLNDKYIYQTLEEGLRSLKEYLYTYDTGYWSKYDHNPKKDILFQIDWNSGEKSFAIDSIELVNPQTNTATKVDIGSSDDFDNYPKISGTEWSVAETIDGKSVRRFINGYKINKEPVNNATRHNVYFLCVLPEQKFDDYFDVPPHKLRITYKDDAAGVFAVKIRSISEGNYLEFKPLKNAIIECVGDGMWKTAEIVIRPQDMGWYMGHDYQRFHVEQIKLIASNTKDWYFQQYAEKWEYYLQSYLNGEEVIRSAK